MLGTSAFSTRMEFSVTTAETTTKDRVFSRLKISQAGAGYIHFPANDGHQVTDEYLEQLVGEKKIICPRRADAHEESHLREDL
jgi:phage terminase large subunit GpA-like protein